MAAAHLQYLFAAEIRLGCRAVVQLDVVPVALIDAASGSPIGGSSS